MTTFIYILVNIILPIFLLICTGFIAQKKLKMDTRTFTRINIYIFVPAVLFLKIYNANVTLLFFGEVLFYIIAIQTAMMLVGECVSRLFKYSRSTKKAFCNSLLFFNSGNYGLPLVELVFRNNPLATTAQIFIMLVQNITSNTFGVFQASSGNSDNKQALKNVFSMPSLYVLFVVLVVKIIKVKVPDVVLVPMQYITGGFIGFALITLGVQLAEINIRFKIRDVLTSSLIRLIISPFIGFALVSALGIKGILAQSLIIGASTPSAVNTAIIAREFDNEPEYASQIVFVSTILSAATISTVIYLVGKYM